MYKILLSIVFLRAISDLSFKAAMHKLNFYSIFDILPNFKKMMLNPFIWGGVFFAIFNILVWSMSLVQFDLHYAYIFISISYTVIILGGKVFFHEKIDKMKMIGIGFILIGVLLLIWGE